MMELLVFLVLLFGLFGMISAQYISQYREAYALWIKEVVYATPAGSSPKKELCSKLEPRRLYEILAEKIENGSIEASAEDIMLIQPLLRNRDAFKSRP